MAPSTESKSVALGQPTLSLPARQSLLSLYAELGRYGNPFPHLMIYFPHLIGTLFAACSAPRTPQLSQLLLVNLVFMPASAVLHGLGCSWNDLVDEPLDRLVERTRNRPLPRGAISRAHAAFFTLAQTLVWLGILALISERVVLCAIPLIPAVAFYPYAKRFFIFPSLVLGVILAYGVALGYASIYPEPLSLMSHEPPSTRLALLSVATAYTFFVTSIDMIYAHQDLRDDLRANIKSMAVTFQANPKAALGALSLLQLAFLLTGGWLMQFGVLYFILACGGNLAMNGAMVWRIDLKDSKNCFWWFQVGTLLNGAALSAGFAAEMLKIGR